MTSKVFLVLSAVAVLLTLQTTQGFTPNHRSRFGVVVSPANTPEMTRPMPMPFPVTSTSLSMATEESEESKEKRKKQQLGAAAVLLFGVLYDFFITHHGVGFWDPNYVV
jgi:hypothetical protein